MVTDNIWKLTINPETMMKQSKTYYSLLFLGLFLLSACQQQTPREQYLAYLQDPAHGLRQQHRGQWFAYRMQVLTPESQALMATPAVNENPARLAALLPQYEHSQSFLLALEPLAPGKSIEEVLKESLGEERGSLLHQNLQYGLEPYFKLIQGLDTLPCTLYQAQAPFFKGDALQMNLVFPKIRPNEDCQLYCAIPEFPEAFPSFSIRQTDLRNIPTLKR